MRLYLAGQSRRDQFVRLVAMALRMIEPKIQIHCPWWDYRLEGAEPAPMARVQYHAEVAALDREAVKSADRVLAVLFPGVQTAGVWWELGLAEGLQIPSQVLILAPPSFPSEEFMQSLVFDQVFLQGQNLHVIQDRLFHSAIPDRLQSEALDSQWMNECLARLKRVLEPWTLEHLKPPLPAFQEG